MSDITMDGHQINAVNALFALSAPIPTIRGVQDFDKLYTPKQQGYLVLRIISR